MQSRKYRRGQLGPLCLLLVCCACEKVPTFQEITNQASPQQAAPATPAQAAPATPAAPAQVQAPVQAPVLEDPQAVIGKFMNTPSNQRSDHDLARLASLASGTETVTQMDLTGSMGISDGGLKHLPKLSNIESLMLTATKFTEAGFSVVTELPKLKTLSLRMTPINGAIVDTTAKLTQLETLLIDSNQIGDDQIAKISGLENIRTLNVSKTLISDASFAQLAKLSRLEVLDASSNRINGLGMQHFKRRVDEAGLRILNVEKTQFGENGFAHLKDCETLEELNANEAAVSDRSLLSLRGHSQLKKLSLGFNPITDAGTKVLGSMRKLEELNLGSTKISDLTFNNISKHKELRLLDVQGTNCTPAGVQKLKKMLPDCVIVFGGMRY